MQGGSAALTADRFLAHATYAILRSVTERTARSTGEHAGGSDELLERAIEAHGGLARWQELTRITAALSAGGVLWASRGHPGALDNLMVTVDPHTQRCWIDGLTGPHRRAVFTADRVAIETTAGELMEERHDPRASFHPGKNAPWDTLQLAYFTGYAMWTYLTVPFLLTQPGFRHEEFQPWKENGETRRRLRVRFPSHIASHCAEQVFHFDPGGLLRRHDYTPAVLVDDPGHLAIAHYTDNHRRYGGISFPTRRRAVPSLPDGTTTPEPEFVTINIHQLTLD